MTALIIPASQEGDSGRVGSAETGSRPAGQAPAGLAASRFDPARLALLMEMEDDWIFYSAELADRSGLSQPEVRRYLREFHAAGLARLTPCYSEDDNTICGSGYSLTCAGVEARIIAKNGERS